MEEYISDHILADVLVRLPFKSLHRFKCVSKAWRDMIHSDYVTGMHSARSRLIQTNPHPDSMILILVDLKQLYAFDAVAKTGKGAYEVVNLRQLCTDLPEYKDPFELVGSCNGILCLNLKYWYDAHRYTVLWNPFTRAYFKLPPPPDDVRRFSQAFGYDHVNDDYKVVIWYLNDRTGSYDLDICVYSLKHNSWTTFELPADKFLDFYCTMANGAAHWLVGDYSDMVILCFDLATYEFRKISCNLPEIDRGLTRMRHLNGCLSFVCYPDRHKRRIGRRSRIEKCGVADVWIMEEYGKQSSLKRLASIDLKKYEHVWTVVVPVVYLRKRGKLLLKLDGALQKLAFYDINRKSFSKVGFKGSESACTLKECVCEQKVGSRCSMFWSRRITRTYCLCVGSFATPSSS